ncbi:hypothetical protein GQ53DRAFT_782074 [Thozetella sp. PMI_491]|nr:hypothetical protein GQ53DRAFT_782074 [Thozetella sp. PMI_491]
MATHMGYTISAASPLYGAAPIQASPGSGSVSPRTAAAPKNVAFELLFRESPQYRARLPLRVSIFPHDTTESIVTTVKNFYGLYSGPSVSKGVSFEDEQGNTLIARYENFQNNMVVYVRVIDETPPPPGAYSTHPYSAPVAAPAVFSGDAYALQPPHQIAQHISRPTSRTSRRRSPSPNSGRGRRSTSVGTNPPTSKKGRSRSSKNRGSANGDAHSDMNGYSSGDGAPGSVSGKSKEQIGTTEISVDNIVEGGRRKRAKFESSELPLFAPPQMPAATSNPSVSPARRIEHYRHSLPYVHPSQNPFTNPRPLQSPQSYTHGPSQASLYTTPSADHRRGRGSIGYLPSAGIAPGMGMMPTPDPTVGSCMSEEDKDVAIQLMRLGEMSNISHGRTSASTLDDTFSGRADAASSTGATSDADSDSEEEMPPARKQKLDSAGNHRNIYPTVENHLQPSVEDSDYSDAEAPIGSMAAPKLKMPKPKANTLNGAKPRPQGLNKIKTPKPNKPKVKKPASMSVPMSPTSVPPSRKPSIASNPALPLAPGEEEQPDLSSKPRCQRCRKSKKGCDRQRPCGRCRDAGLPAELCISEDEGNGRKGRYGRHMGVPISKDAVLPIPPPTLLPPAPIAAAMPAPPIMSAQAVLDKNKKRKR